MRVINKTVLALGCAGVLAFTPAHAQKPDSLGVYELRAIQVMPRPLNIAALQRAMEASYPPAARAAGSSGQVTVRMIVGPDGMPKDVRVVASTDATFNAPTLQAVMQLRFSPGRVANRPVPVYVQIPIQWQVEDPDVPATTPAGSR